MKVKLLPKVSSFLYNGIDYKPGDKFEVEPKLYRADFMQSLESAKTVSPPPKPEPAVEEAKPVVAEKKAIIEKPEEKKTEKKKPVNKKKAEAKTASKPSETSKLESEDTSTAKDS